jgi:diaphanous 1
LELHDAQPKLPAAPPTPVIQEPIPEEKPAEPVSIPPYCEALSLTDRQTVKLTPAETATENNTLKPDRSQGYAAGRSVGRGDLDQAIRSMRDGRRRARPDRDHRALSKIFMDGSNRQSRIYE